MSDPAQRHGIEGVELIGFAPGVQRLRVRVVAGEPPTATSEVERVWGEMRGANPRLYSGPILAVTGIDAARGEITARRDTYQRLVVQPRVPTGVRQLSITAVVVRTGAKGPEVLLGRRSAQTRMYAGMWELGPAGGVEPPQGAGEIGHGALMDELRREAREEAGLGVSGEGRPLGIAYDARAESYDVVLLVGFAGQSPERSWEYQELRWLPLGEAGRFERERAGEIIPPTRAVLREWVPGLGLVGG